MHDRLAGSLKRSSIPLLFIVTAMVGTTGLALAGGSWFSKAHTVPLAADAPLSPFWTSTTAAPPVGTEVFDLVVSICNNYPSCAPDYPPESQDPQSPYQAYTEIMSHWADAVCEQSNGALRLGKIRIFRNAAQFNIADVQWYAGQDGRPVSDVSGFGVFGQTAAIRMYDDDDNNSGNGTFLTERTKGGYALGHEIAHYVLGLYDEYSESGLGGGELPDDNDLNLPTIMGPDYADAANNNYSLLNHSIPGNYQPGSNPPGSCSSAEDCLSKTAQGRVYGKSAWEVLLQTDDGQSGDLNLQPDRVRYAALEGAKPQDSNGNWQTDVDLPAEQQYCRQHLDVEWMQSDIELQLIIDRSGSMRSTPMDNAKIGAAYLVDTLEHGETALGIVAFDATKEQLCLRVPSDLCDALTSRILPINTDADEIPIRTTVIPDINADGPNNVRTSMYDGAAEALSNLQSYASDNQTTATQLAFLLSDGLDNNSLATQAGVESSYSAASVPLSTFAYGNFAPEGVLLQMAEATGGLYRVSPTTLQDLQSAFLAVKAALTSSSTIVQEARLIPPEKSERFRFAVDSTLKELSLYVTHGAHQEGSGDLTLRLIGPGNVEVDADFSCQDLAGTTSCSLALSQQVLEKHGVGEWSLQASNATSADLDVKLDITGNPLNVVPYDLAAASKSGPTVKYPRPILLTATASRGMRITGVDISATVARAGDPAGSKQPVVFVDDGTGGDWRAGDGIYSAIVDYDANDTYTIEVRVNNEPRDAQFTTLGLHPSSAPLDGKRTQREPLLPPIDENFSRTTTIQVVTSGIVDSDQDGIPDDDHSNSPPGTEVLPDSAATAGRIEILGDIDVFTVPIDGPGYINLRVAKLALGMEPRLRVEKQTQENDIQEVIPEVTIEKLADGSAYLAVAVPVDDATSHVHAFVSHASGGTGYYEFSAGGRIVSDPPILQIDIEPDSTENIVNPYWPGHVTVAALGSEIYDIRQIDPEALAFGPKGAPAVDPNGGSFDDVNGDSLEDYINSYSFEASGIRPGDTRACLSGEVSGIPFTACDEILTIHLLWLLVLVFILLVLLLFAYLYRLRKRKNAQTENNAPEA